MSIIGLLSEHSDMLILLYSVLLIVSLVLLFKRTILINSMGFGDVMVSVILVILTFTFVKSYTLKSKHYVDLWRLIYRELTHIRKTYGVVEIRLVFHFLIKQVQLKSFYGDELDPLVGVDIIKIVESWSRVMFRELAVFNLDATYRVRVICLEKAIKQGLKPPP